MLPQRGARLRGSCQRRLTEGVAPTVHPPRMKPPPSRRYAPSHLPQWGGSRLENLEQPRSPHAAADAHGDDAVLGLAALALIHQVGGTAGAGHAVGMADGDRAAGDVVLRRVDAELVAAIENLAREGLVQLPDVDVVDGQAVALGEVRNRKHRADAHLLRAAAGDGHAAIGAQRLQATLLGFLALHQHHRCGAVGELAGVAGGDVLALLDVAAALEHGCKLLQVGERRLRAVALVGADGDFLIRRLAGLLVDQHLHDRGHGRDLPVEAAFRLGLGGALLRLEGVFVLRLAADAVALGDDLGGLDHRGAEFGHVILQPRIDGHEAVDVAVLNQADRLDAGADGDRGAVVDDVLGGGGDTHQAGAALAVDGHAGDGVGKARPQRRLAGDVVARRALLQGAAHGDVIDLARVDAGLLDRRGDGVTAQRRAIGVVERAAVGLADGGPAGGDDDGFTHGECPAFGEELGLEVGELLALGDQLLEQRRGLERLAHGRLEFLHLGQHLVRADLVAVVHRAAAVDRPAVAVDPDHIDVGGADRLALFEDLRALVDHRIDAAFEDLLVADLARVGARFDDEVVDDLLGDGAGLGGALFVVVVVARAGLLAAAVHLAEHVADGLALGVLLHPADVEAGQIAHRKRAHGEAEVVEHPVDVPGHGAFHDQLLGLTLSLGEHPVANEAWAHAGQDRDLADLLGELHRGGDDVLGGLLAAHDLQQLHDIGRREEVQADHVPRPAGHRSDLVDVEVAGVRRQDGAGLGHLVQAGEDVLLDVHPLEDGLDDQVAVGELLEVQRAGEQRHPRLGLLWLGGARALVVLADRGEAAFQSGFLHLDDGHRDAGVEEVHGDAAAHGAGAQ